MHNHALNSRFVRFWFLALAICIFEMPTAAFAGVGGVGLAAVERTTAEDLIAQNSRGDEFHIAVQLNGGWSVTVESAGVRRMFVPEQCRALDDVILAFKTLPNLMIRPYGWIDHGDPQPIPPTTMDGAVWTIWTSAYASDGSDVDVVIRGDQGPYAAWAGSVLRILASCEVK